MSTRLIDLVLDFHAAKAALREAKENLEASKQRIIARYGVGKYKDCTVFKVKGTTVKAFKRDGYTAVRWHVPKE
jgi:hypothetical protein